MPFVSLLTAILLLSSPPTLFQSSHSPPTGSCWLLVNATMSSSLLIRLQAIIGSEPRSPRTARVLTTSTAAAFSPTPAPKSPTRQQAVQLPPTSARTRAHLRHGGTRPYQAQTFS